MLELRAVLTLSSTPARPYEKRDISSGRISYTMRSIQGDGVILAGAAAQTPEDDEAAQSGIDVMSVSALNLLAFKQGDSDPAFDKIGDLQRGDKVMVWFSFELANIAVDGKVRLTPRLGRIASIEVVERAAGAAGRRAGFVDSSADVAVAVAR